MIRTDFTDVEYQFSNAHCSGDVPEISGQSYCTVVAREMISDGLVTLYPHTVTHPILAR
jgi:hypothetical protein